VGGRGRVSQRGEDEQEWGGSMNVGKDKAKGEDKPNWGGSTKVIQDQCVTTISTNG